LRKPRFPRGLRTARLLVQHSVTIGARMRLDLAAAEWVISVIHKEFYSKVISSLSKN